MLPETINPSKIQPPEIRCAHCGGELEIFNDPKTNSLTRHRRRALMKCTQCGELQVTADPIFENRRYRIARIIGWIGAVAFIIVEVITEHARFTDEPLSQPWFILSIMTLMLALITGLLCKSLVEAILPGKPPDRLAAVITGLMMLAALIGMLFVMRSTLASLDRNRMGPPPTPLPEFPSMSSP